jgi:hypothetical protein
MVPGMAGALCAAAKPEAAIRAAIRMESVDLFISVSLKVRRVMSKTASDVLGVWPGGSLKTPPI